MLDKAYDPKQHENSIYSFWERSGYFNPDNLPGERKEKFSMVLPPPNVTGTLHTGHALTVTIEDIMVRFHRMRGKKTLWLPGTDHAAIATQAKVEKELYKKEGKSRHDLGRDDFLRRVEEFALASQETILGQLRTMGASLDWSRLAYTLDEPRRVAVYEAFRRMHEAGIIYRGHRVINWDPKGQTTVSDDEVVHNETRGKLYTFKYDESFPFPIATTRPETKLGDTAVAVNPNDERYAQYIGKTFSVNFVGVPLEITIIGDPSVDPAFGTGAVGVTPAHSMTDWEMAQRHNVPLKQVIDERARIFNTKTQLDGETTLKAREKVLSMLSESGLLVKEEEIEMNVGVAERTGGIIEPLPKLQWFIDVNKSIESRGGKSLKELMRDAVSQKNINIVPERFEKIYFNWIDNLRDWCISRQLWFGHRIPVWYKGEEIKISSESPGEAWKQDSDTLDTWFSAGLWTFSTLGWPQKTEDLATYHPTNVLETGYDILFFWVARMILMSEFLIGEVPFRTVYLHGIVRDEQKRKMSKSLDNIIDPTDMSKKYGTDALRMALVVGNAPGNDFALSEDKIKAHKHFANKVWNASRFVLMNMGGFNESDSPKFSESDTQTLSEFAAFTADVTDDIENYRFHLASEKLYHYFWHTFADKIIEEQKNRLRSEHPSEKSAAQHILITLLKAQLTLLHPFMPFITEVIWKELPKAAADSDLLIVQSWPQ